MGFFGYFIFIHYPDNCGKSFLVILEDFYNHFISKQF